MQGGDDFKKVLRGQPLRIPAAAYNAFLDTVRWVRSQQPIFRTESSSQFKQSGIIKLLNASGADRNQFSILGLDTPIISPEDNYDEFAKRVTFNGVVPRNGVHNGRFAVLLEPIAAGSIGLAVVSGVVPVQLQVNVSQLYDWADIMDANTTTLLNVPHGTARVLWIDLNVAQSVRWAIVRLDVGDYEAHVYIASNIPDANGYYSGIVQRYDPTTNSWIDLFPCKVMDVNQ